MTNDDTWPSGPRVTCLPDIHAGEPGECPGVRARLVIEKRPAEAEAVPDSQ